MEKDNIIYAGIFLDNSIPANKALKTVKDQHLTLAFKPTKEQLMQIIPIQGKKVTISFCGYAKNDNNEAFKVNLPENIPYFGAEQKHITIGLSDNGKAVESANLIFKDFDKDEIFTLDGKIGLWTPYGIFKDERK